jgi:hypothetical protein
LEGSWLKSRLLLGLGLESGLLLGLGLEGSWLSLGLHLLKHSWLRLGLVKLVWLSETGWLTNLTLLTGGLSKVLDLLTLGLDLVRLLLTNDLVSQQLLLLLTGLARLGLTKELWDLLLLTWLTNNLLLTWLALEASALNMMVHLSLLGLLLSLVVNCWLISNQSLLMSLLSDNHNTTDWLHDCAWLSILLRNWSRSEALRLSHWLTSWGYKVLLHLGLTNKWLWLLLLHLLLLLWYDYRLWLKPLLVVSVMVHETSWLTRLQRWSGLLGLRVNQVGQTDSQQGRENCNSQHN